jgi:DNA-binding IclR family transcriptional regulator
MWLCDQERIILHYLQNCGENGASPREICRKASTKDVWKKDERWAYRHLTTLKEKKLVETTPAGNYKLPPPPDEEEERRKNERKGGV